MGVQQGDVHSVINVVIKIQGDIEVGDLHLGSHLGNGKEGSDVRDIMDEKQEVLDHQSADGIRQGTDYLIRVRLSSPGGRKNGNILGKIGYLGKMTDLVLDMLVLSTLEHPGRNTYQAGISACEGIHGSEKKRKQSLH